MSSPSGKIGVIEAQVSFHEIPGGAVDRSQVDAEMLELGGAESPQVGAGERREAHVQSYALAFVFHVHIVHFCKIGRK